MKVPSRLFAVLVYILPIIGWLFVYLFQRKNALAIYHLRQAIGLFLVLVGILIGWLVIAWIVVWIPYLGTLSAALFTIVMAAYFFGFVAWVLGIINVLRNRMTPLPWFGRWANHLPIQAPQ
jgi:uncharacterized membrane protein